MRTNINAGALIMVMLLWGLHLGYPMNLTQNWRWTVLGYLVPVYYVFTVLLMMGAAVIVVTLKQRWSKWELLWCLLPLICLPGVLHSSDIPWSLRQWFSWIIRGVIPGGIIFLNTNRKKMEAMLFWWIYPVIIAAALLGLWELYSHHNPFWDRFDYNFTGYIVKTSQPINPFYRPREDFGSYLQPRGTQGNRIPYAATLVGFLPLGLWLLKYRRRYYPAHLLAVGVLIPVLLLAQVRAVWVATLLSLLLMRTVGLLRERREMANIAAGMLICLGVFMAWPRTHNMLWNRLNSFHLADLNIRLRLDMLETAGVLRDHWFSGVGFGQFPTECKPYYHGALAWIGTADNQYLRWLTENGIPGFVLLLIFFGGLVRAGWKSIQGMKNIEQADFYKSLLVGWISIAVTFLFFDGFYWGACNMTFWSLLGIFATCMESPEFQGA
jgi:hypothetical protein